MKVFSEEQIFVALQQQRSGVSIGAICQLLGCGERILYEWNRLYGDLPIVEIRRIRNENKRSRSNNCAPPRCVAEFATHCADAYGVDRYLGGWGPSIELLRAHRYTDPQIEAILRSRWPRHAADRCFLPYGHATAENLLSYVEKQGPAALAKLVDQLSIIIFRVDAEGNIPNGNVGRRGINQATRVRKVT